MKISHSALRTTLIFQLVFACCLFDLANSQATTQVPSNVVTITGPPTAAGGLGQPCSASNTCDPTPGGLVCEAGNCRISLNFSCQPLETGLSPCIQPDATICHGNFCRCNDDFYSNDITQCLPRLLVGAKCSVSEKKCVLMASCINDTCFCDTGFYKNESGHCQTRILVGGSCPSTLTETPCVEGAICNRNDICQCVEHQYRTDGQTCTPIKGPGGICTDLTECMDHAVCNGTCNCPRDRFYDLSANICQLRKAPGEHCTTHETCVENANCQPNGVCVCEIHYYNHNQQCFRRQLLGHLCDITVPDECLINGECVNDHCRCNNKSYNNENANCPLTLNFTQPCNWENHDPRQCESNTSCVFRTSDNRPICGCDSNHFFNGLYCIKRAKAGETCPYDIAVHFGLDRAVPEINKQCVDNAVCNEVNVCECSTGYYDRAGHCPHRIHVNDICDPWRDYPDQCADGAQCLYGRCVSTSA